MNQTTRALITDLKNSEEDFEFYPTTKEMISVIFNHIEDSHIDVLDIGCGTCHFKKYYDELANEKYSIDFEREKQLFIEDHPEDTGYHFNGNYRGYSVIKKRINQYYVMEKSRILLDRLDKEVIVLGTNFHDSMLIDKPVNTIFCNPPYSEYKHWMTRIINEGNCYDIYLIVPERWKEDKDINALLERKQITVQVLSKFDFLEADRISRAKVDILHIIKKSEDRRQDLPNIEEDAFNDWFDETFKMRDVSEEEEKLADYEKRNKEKKELKNKLISCEPKDKAKTLIKLYTDELTTLFNNFKAICSMDAEVLETIGVSKESIKKAIKQKTINLKTLYWEAVFNEMEEITSRLTHKTRDHMLEKFKELNTVEFTEANIYSLIIWVIKNANQYYDDQLITFYKELSTWDNVRPYKSNQKTFQKDGWRFNTEKQSHYTLDYRIICSNYIMGIQTDSWSNGLRTGYEYDQKIKDIKAIFNNLGFEIFRVETPTNFGEKCYAYGQEGKEMFEFKTYKNGNLHLKFNIEFTKAMNVEVSRLLGWIRNKEDIKKEFPEEMAKDAEKYFKANQQIALETGTKLLG